MRILFEGVIYDIRAIAEVTRKKALAIRAERKGNVELSELIIKPDECDIIELTQEDFDAIEIKDPTKYYFILVE